MRSTSVGRSHSATRSQQSRSMASDAPWDGSTMPSQRNKIVIVTGASSGLGLVTARRLAERGARVVLACRNEGRGRAAEAQIIEALKKTGDGAGSVELMLVDVGSLASVKAFATAFAQRFDRLDLLINNAGVGMPVEQKSTDGLAVQFGVNHLGHFYLTTLLFDRLKASPSARVVNISSVLHRRLVDRLFFRSLEVDFSQLATGDSDSPCTRYEKSKLCNLLFTYELDRRLKAANIRNVISVAAHPGTTATPIFDRSIEYYNPSCLHRIAKKITYMCLQGVEMGALPILFAATVESVQSGEYYGPDGFLNFFGYPAREISSPLSYSEAYGQQLWSLSEQLTKQPFSLVK
ncbi:hypothetical protein PINS_up000616 [Pythium insidiosum]|nr:hypothetical protein PINS_up000616 [Pythium insidiosum]